MADPILDGWWQRNLAQAKALAAASMVLAVHSLHPHAKRHLIVRFECTGLIRQPDGRIVEAHEFMIRLAFPPDYLHRVDARQVLMLLRPLEIWHPNILGPFICAGHLHPGMAIVDLIYQVFEMLTYRHYALHDPLNMDAAIWARQPENQARFPLDRRPLKQRQIVAQQEVQG